MKNQTNNLCDSVYQHVFDLLDGEIDVDSMGAGLVATMCANVVRGCMNAFAGEGKFKDVGVDASGDELGMVRAMLDDFSSD